MFKLYTATVHYGASSYPLHGLPAKYNTISGIEDLDAEELMTEVGRLTHFPREFKIRHFPRQEFPGIKLANGEDLVIPEQIFAQAKGYSIGWVRV